MKRFKVRIFVFVLILAISFTAELLYKSRTLAVSSYQYFQPILVKTADDIPNDYTVSVNFDHKSLVELNKSLQNGDDIRIFYDSTGIFAGDQIELDRVLDEKSNWNTVDTKIWFKLKSTLTNNITDSVHYRLYYGNTNASLPPINKSNVYYLWDDFSDTSMSGWSIILGDWSKVDGVLRWKNSGAGRISPLLLPIDNFFAEYTLSSTHNLAAVSLWGRFFEMNFFGFGNDPVYQGGVWLVVKYAGGGGDVQDMNFSEPPPKSNDRVGMKITGGTVVGYLNNKIISSHTWDSLLSGDRIVIAADSYAPRDGSTAVDFDNFLVRKAVANEPIVTLGEELTPSPTPTPTFTPTPTLTPTPSPSPSPTPTNTPTPTFTPTPTPTPTPIPDTTPPETLIDDHPQNLTASSSANFSFHSNEEATFSCGLDTSELTICISPITYSDLTEGSHVFFVQAKDTAGNKDQSPAQFNWQIDKTPPSLVSSETQDSDKDGKIDNLKLTFSENISDSSWTKDTPSGFDVLGYSGEKLQTGSGDNDTILILKFDENSEPDSSNQPVLNYTAGIISDLAGNKLAGFNVTTTDKAFPFLLSGYTQDSDGNGKIDKIVATFSEDLHGSSVTKNDFAITLPSRTITDSSELEGVVTIFLIEDSYFDTGTKPTLTVKPRDENSGTGVKDLHNNWNEEKSIIVTDKTAPFLIVNLTEDNTATNSAISFSGVASDYASDESSITTAVTLSQKKQGEASWQEIAVLNNDELVEPFDYGSYQWTPSQEGIYDFKTEAKDLNDNLTEKTVTNVLFDQTKSSVFWEEPTQATVSGTINLKVLASDAGSGVKEAVFKYKKEGEAQWQTVKTVQTPPYQTTLNTTQVSLGTYTLLAEVSDVAGNVVNIEKKIDITTVISSEQLVNFSSSSLTVYWLTSQPTTSRVVYDTVSHLTLGSAPNYGYAFSTPEADLEKTTSHKVTMTGLKDNTTYYFRFVSKGSPESISEESSAKTSSTSGSNSSSSSSSSSPSTSSSTNTTNSSVTPTSTSAPTVSYLAAFAPLAEVLGVSEIATSGSVLGEEKIINTANLSNQQPTLSMTLWEKRLVFVILVIFLVLIIIFRFFLSK